MSAFDRAFTFVIGVEGGYQRNGADPGNWTGGRCTVGECLGTNWGISAAAYPTLDIPGLQRADAGAIYRRDYWERIRGDDLPGPLALVVFDAAVNSGVPQASRWLQMIAAVRPDGVIGPTTLTGIARAIDRQEATGVCAEYLAQRLVFMASLPAWKTFGSGWSRRLCRLAYQSMTMDLP